MNGRAAAALSAICLPHIQCLFPGGVSAADTKTDCAAANPAAILWGVARTSHCYATSPLLRCNKNLPFHATSHIVSMT
ncbi:MAG TPA: hypothetical protein VG742_05015 [Dongiaceae bacterium]|nr:hypothetical protein [Dongiaceae bacterium]